MPAARHGNNNWRRPARAHARLTWLAGTAHAVLPCYEARMYGIVLVASAQAMRYH